MNRDKFNLRAPWNFGLTRLKEVVFLKAVVAHVNMASVEIIFQRKTPYCVFETLSDKKGLLLQSKMICGFLVKEFDIDMQVMLGIRLRPSLKGCVGLFEADSLTGYQRGGTIISVTLNLVVGSEIKKIIGEEKE